MYIPKWVLMVLIGAAGVVGGWIIHAALSGGHSPSANTAHSAPVAAAAKHVRPAAAPPRSVTVVVPPTGAGTKPQVFEVAATPAAGACGGGTLPGQVGTASLVSPGQRAATAGVIVFADIRGSKGSWTTMLDHPIYVQGSGNTLGTERSVVVVGANARLDANTGDTGNRAIATIDSQGSSFATGQSPSTVRKPSSVSDLTDTIHQDVDGNSTGGHRQVVIDGGYEDHSVLVAGDDNAATYDDSNLFVHRDGHINGNTGDTDSSGLNAVDTVDSVVKSGHSIEEPGSSDSSDSSDSGDSTDSAPAAITATQSSGSDGDSGGGDDESPAPISHPGSGGSLQIGGDGFDNISMHVLGNRNVATEDDGNVVIGGHGDVNAQIGDSDTSGTVTMHTVRSTVEGNKSE